MELETCPNCKKKLSGMLVTRSLYKQPSIDFINIFKVDPSNGYCSDCGPSLINGSIAKLQKQKENTVIELTKNIDIIPIVTAQSPLKWDYSVIEIVSAQSVTGTGMLSEISSSWADFLGGQSDALSNKLSNGELICKNKLRLSAALLGANCIIATDIDYAEVGGGKGMLMVCMAGTAAILHNIADVLNIDANRMASLNEAAMELKRLNAIKLPQYN
jgi:uncharacterized protein YbjQ (UPF0145 family)